MTKELNMSAITNDTPEELNQNMLIKYANKKNSILHMLAHDLRGPLGVANSLVKTINQQTDPDALKKKTNYIANILEQSIDLINDLVAREELEATAVKFIKKRINIAQLLADYMEECRRSHQLAERTITYVSSAEEIYVNLDNSKFMQIINNLISNALKFTQPGGHIKLTVNAEGQHVNLQMADDGIGIPKDLLPVIFDKFTPAARAGINGEPTIGLGLSIVRTIVEWHDGEISCDSEEGKGTSFNIRLPRS